MVDRLQDNVIARLQPACTVFGECGGCQYQDIPYEQELALKTAYVKEHLKSRAGIDEHKVQPIVPSPEIYNYRNKLDVKMHRTRERGILMGFSQYNQNWTIPVDSCPVALKHLSDFLPKLREQALPKFTDKYRMANLVVKTGDDGRIVWGGIGKRSLSQSKEEYLWVSINNKKVFYALDTFFQANRFILPKIIDKVLSQHFLTRDTVFFDLYAGVGLFGLFVADKVQKVVMIEENSASIAVAKHNAEYNGIMNVDVISGRVEDVLVQSLGSYPSCPKAALIDPPRGGLKKETAEFLSRCTALGHLCYLSCHVETLADDLALLCAGGWSVQEVCPFDFFPRTKHVETFVVLKNRKEQR